MDTSQRLKAVRGSLTQADFAQKIGVHKNSLGRYERGESTPDMDTIARVCLVFGVSPQWLVLGEGEMHRLSPFSVVLERADVPIRLPQPPHERADKFCPLCLELRAELSAERQERRELTAENRFLWKENSSLREKVAQLEAFNHQECHTRLEEKAHQVA